MAHLIMTDLVLRAKRAKNFANKHGHGSEIGYNEVSIGWRLVREWSAIYRSPHNEMGQVDFFRMPL